jgi:DNA-binding transcriptional LysR family regulator
VRARALAQRLQPSSDHAFLHGLERTARLAAVQDWDDLRYFLAVAREGSLSKAALRLGVAQPTAGRRLKAFEKRLGARLFLPTSAGQEVTPTGRRVLALAERIELDVLGVERLASGRDAGLSGRVTLTASEWLLELVVAPLLAPLCARYPELELELLAQTRHLSLVRREADLALRPSRFEHADVVERAVGTVGFALYASQAYLAEHGVPDFARQAEDQRLIAMSSDLTRIPDLEWLPGFASRARVVARANGRGPMLRMAEAGVGLACLPRILGDASAVLRRVSTPQPDPERTLFLGVHRDARAVPRVRAVTNFLIETFGRLRPALRGSP